MKPIVLTLAVVLAIYCLMTRSIEGIEWVIGGLAVWLAILVIAAAAKIPRWWRKQREEEEEARALLADLRSGHNPDPLA